MNKNGRPKSLNSHTYSKYRGVVRSSAGTSWTVVFGSKTYGGFSSEEEAAHFFDRVVKRKLGDETILNFPEKI